MLPDFFSNPRCDALEGRVSGPALLVVSQPIRLELVVLWVLHIAKQFVPLRSVKYA